MSLHLLVNIHCIVLGNGDDTGSLFTKKDVNRSLPGSHGNICHSPLSAGVSEHIWWALIGILGLSHLVISGSLVVVGNSDQ